MPILLQFLIMLYVLVKWNVYIGFKFFSGLLSGLLCFTGGVVFTPASHQMLFEWHTSCVGWIMLCVQGFLCYFFEQPRHDELGEKDLLIDGRCPLIWFCSTCSSCKKVSPIRHVHFFYRSPVRISCSWTVTIYPSLLLHETGHSLSATDQCVNFWLKNS